MFGVLHRTKGLPHPTHRTESCAPSEGALCSRRHKVGGHSQTLFGGHPTGEPPKKVSQWGPRDGSLPCPTLGGGGGAGLHYYSLPRPTTTYYYLLLRLRQQQLQQLLLPTYLPTYLPTDLPTCDLLLPTTTYCDLQVPTTYL